MWLEAPRAVTATTLKLVRIVYNPMRYGVACAKRSEPEYVAEQRNRLDKSLQCRAKESGYGLVKADGEGVKLYPPNNTAQPEENPNAR